MLCVASCVIVSVFCVLCVCDRVCFLLQRGCAACLRTAVWSCMVCCFVFVCRCVCVDKYVRVLFSMCCVVLCEAVLRLFVIVCAL